VTIDIKGILRFLWPVVVSFLVFVFLPQTPVFGAHWYSHYRAGKKHFEARNFNKAVIELEKAVRMNDQPGQKRISDLEMIDYTPFNLLAQSFRSLGKDADAVTYFRKSLETETWLPRLQHESIDSLIEIAVKFEGQSQFEQADNIFAFLERYPQSSAIGRRALLRAREFARQGDHKKALLEFNKAENALYLKIDKPEFWNDYVVYLNAMWQGLGEEAVVREKIKARSAELLELAQDSPELSEEKRFMLHDIVGNVFYEENDLAQALNYFERALPYLQKCCCDCEKSYGRLAKSYVVQASKTPNDSYYEKAWTLFQNLKRCHDPEGMYSYYLGQIDLYQHNDLGAIQNFEQAIKEGHKSPDIMKILGILYLKNQSYQNALEKFVLYRSRSTGPEDADNYLDKTRQQINEAQKTYTKTSQVITVPADSEILSDPTSVSDIVLKTTREFRPKARFEHDEYWGFSPQDFNLSDSNDADEIVWTKAQGNDATSIRRPRDIRAEILRDYQSKSALAIGDMFRKYNADILILHFWHSSCVPCLQEMPDVISFAQKYRKKDIILLGITSDVDDQKVVKLIKKFKIDFPVYYDRGDGLLEKFRKDREIPFSVIINNKGDILHRIMGKYSWDKPDQDFMRLLK